MASIVDAQNGKVRTIHLEGDRHGACISIEGSTKTVIVDLCNDQLRVYISDEDDGLVDDPLTTIDLSEVPAQEPNGA